MQESGKFPALRSIYPNWSDKMNKTILKRIGPYSVIAPGLLLLAALALYPFVFLVKISFQEYSPINSRNPFVGLDNYIRLLTYINFWNSIRVTVTFVVAAVAIELVLGLGLALLYNQHLIGKRILRTLILLPIVMTPTVVGLMFRFMMNEQYGILNFFISILGAQRTAWLSDINYALPALIATDIWQWTPFMLLILLAGLQGLPEEVYEAVRVDGASKWQAFIYVTVPMLSKVIYIAALLRVIDSFRAYDTVYMMTRGGPINATSTMSWLVYDKGFRTLDFGFGAAICVVMLIIMLSILPAVLRKMDMFELEKR